MDLANSERYVSLQAAQRLRWHSSIPIHSWIRDSHMPIGILVRAYAYAS